MTVEVKLMIFLCCTSSESFVNTYVRRYVRYTCSSILLYRLCGLDVNPVADGRSTLYLATRPLDQIAHHANSTLLEELIRYHLESSQHGSDNSNALACFVVNVILAPY